MKPIKLVTLINVELIIVCSHSNSRAYRCFTWNENLAATKTRVGAARTRETAGLAAHGPIG